MVEAAKRRHWAEELARGGPAAALRATHALWRHVRRLRPGWPTEAERADDLAHHIELKARIDQAARGLAQGALPRR